MNKLLSNKKVLSYIGIFVVVFVWGISPLVTYELNRHYSPTFKVAISEIILVLTYLAVSGKKIKALDMSYIKPGLVTGIFLALANISQKIGLLYTTPAKYAFLENLSCIAVPVVLYFLIRKKPTVFTYLSSIICLAGVFILNGISLDGSWGIGELLCAAAGIFYGFNIAGTACYAKKLYAPLYLAVQSAVGFVISLIFAIILNFWPAGDGGVIEKIVFSHNIKLFVFMIFYVVITSAFCWIIRTNSLKYIPASAVSVIMPFSAVVTAIASILAGTDTLSLNIVLGGFLAVAAIIISSFDK